MWLQVLIRHSSHVAPPVYPPPWGGYLGTGQVPGHGGHNGRGPAGADDGVFHIIVACDGPQSTQHLLHQLLERQQCTGFPQQRRASGAWLLDGGGCGAVSCLLSEHTGDHSGVCRQHGTASLSITRCVEKAGEAWGGGPCGSGHLRPGQAFG